VNAETLAWHQLRYEHTQVVRAVLADRYAAATVNKMLSALRGVLRECWRLGLISADDYQRAADLATVKGSTLPRGRALAAGELRALLADCAADLGENRNPRQGSRRFAAGRRDAAIVATLYAGGLRRAEAVALDLSDYAINTGQLTVRAGKGNKARLVYAQGGAAGYLADWLAVRGSSAGPLFCPVDKAGRVALRRMTPQAILYLLRRRAERAGVAAFSPHDLRRTFISDLLDAGADIATVRGLAGHANIQTTARYDRRGEITKQRAAELLHVPYLASGDR